MNQNPTLSVCMITYGHENFIRQAIEGVLMQQCDFEIELIIANDCSPDNTDAVIRNIIENHANGNWIRYIRHDTNLGMMPNSIFALQKCKGKYIALCEGDDYWTDPLKLQKQVDFLERNPDYVLSFHPVDILNQNGHILTDFITKVPKNFESKVTLAQLGNYIHTPSVVFKNVIMQFPLEFYKTPVGDYFLYMMLGSFGDFGYQRDKMAIYRNGVGIYSSLSNSRKVNLEIKMLSCYLSYSKEEHINQILLERQFVLITKLRGCINEEARTSLLQEAFLYRTIVYLKNNYRRPLKIINKIIHKLSK